ncbi:MAG: ABC transporter ATP-binding protein [Solirubrobacteraceae bacterium]
MSALELREVTKHYPSSGETVRAVDGVSLTVSPAELVALYGPSGSGKTTLLELAAGLLKPDAGSIHFSGRDVSSLTAAESAVYRRRDVGLVFQSFHLIAGATALDNAAVKLLADGMTLRAARERALPWLHRVGLGGRTDHTPARLSMGERQRIAIARALVNEPRLLLTDEPTGNLDSKRSREILALLQEICEERRIPGLLVTHDPQASAYASKVFTLRDGMLREGLDAELALARSQ